MLACNVEAGLEVLLAGAIEAGSTVEDYKMNNLLVNKKYEQKNMFPFP